MGVEIQKKLNWLHRNLPEGLLVDAAWLETRGYYGSLRKRYVTSGWLEQPARGAYRRPGEKLSWEQIVISLQMLLKLPVSVGGRTALDLQGYGHYIARKWTLIHLYTDARLPGWVSKLPVDASFAVHNRGRFLPVVGGNQGVSNASDANGQSDAELPGGLRVLRWGHWEWPLIISTPERAILEMIDELPRHETFHNVDVTMEGLVDLSPRRMQKLLQETSSVKVKRLFFFFADRHEHPWRKHIDLEQIDIGKGKRVIAEGGKLDTVYNITVPQEMANAIQ